MHNLTQPQHNRRRSEQYQPILPFQRHYAEHLASEGHDKHLSDKNDEYRHKEHLAFTNLLEAGVSAFEGFGVEQVPKLEEHEEREEHRQIVRRYRSVNRVKLEIVGKELTERKGRQFGFRAVFQILEKAEKHEHEHSTHTDDKPFHRTVDDKVRHLARLVLHHLHAGRQMCP